MMACSDLGSRACSPWGDTENEHSTDVEFPPRSPPRICTSILPEGMLGSRFECLFSMTLLQVKVYRDGNSLFHCARLAEILCQAGAYICPLLSSS